MTAGMVADPLTVRTILFAGSGVDAATALTNSLDAAGMTRAVLGRIEGLSGAAQQEVKHQMGAVAAGALDVDVADLVVGGWRKHTALVAAARRTLAVPGSEEIVDLASHRIRSVHRPYMTVLVDGVRVAKIDFELTIVFTIKALVAVVRAGRLVALGSGQCEATATLAVEGVTLAQQRGRLDLNLCVPLGAGIQLVPRDAGVPLEPLP